jgi:WS/DGAT/MGAT family acyltransferase
MKQLGILDSAFINMEHKNVPQHIGSFGIYDQSTAPGGKVRFKSVIKHFERQIKKIPLFRTRLIQSPGRFARPYWLVDDNFDVEFHLRHIALPYPGDWRQLCILIARLHSRPIDMSRPLWESYVIEGLENIDGLPSDCFVIYTKIHHSIVDGGGADNFMAAIHDLEPKVHDEDEDLPDDVYIGEQKPSSYEMVTNGTRSYLNNVWGLTKGGFALSQEVAKTAVKLAKGEMKAPPTDAPTTRFNRPVGGYRVIEASKFNFEDFREIKNKTNTKVNDVALAVVSGAMRKYLDAHNEHPNTSLVASVPMNMRTRNGDTGEANQVGSIFTSLNSTVDDPLERLIAIHKSTDEAKEFAENAPLKDALKLAGAMSPRVTKSLINTYVDNKLTKHLPMKINTVVSNVPGPNFPLYCSGAKLIQYNGLGVLTPGVGIFHLVFTYCGQVTITMMADRDAMPDPGFYRECMDASFDDLKKAVAKAEALAEANKDKTPKPKKKSAKATIKKAEEVIATAEKVIADEAKTVERKRASRKASGSSSSTKSAPANNSDEKAESATETKPKRRIKSRKASSSSSSNTVS